MGLIGFSREQSTADVPLSCSFLEKEGFVGVRLTGTVFQSRSAQLMCLPIRLPSELLLLTDSFPWLFH